MGQPKNEVLYYTIGRGLHEWSLVEMELARVFAALSGANSHQLFGAVISFDTRIAMCDRLMELAPHDELEKTMWIKLSTRLSKFYRKRHELAHFTIGKNPKGEDAIFPFLNTATIRLPNPQMLVAEQISDRIQHFIDLQAALIWFAKIIPRRRMPKQEPMLKPLAEPTLVARLRELATQTLEERAQRGKSPRR